MSLLEIGEDVHLLLLVLLGLGLFVFLFGLDYFWSSAEVVGHLVGSGLIY